MLLFLALLYVIHIVLLQYSELALGPDALQIHLIGRGSVPHPSPLASEPCTAPIPAQEKHV